MHNPTGQKYAIAETVLVSHQQHKQCLHSSHQKPFLCLAAEQLPKNVEELWSRGKDALVEAAEEHVPRKKKTKKPLLSTKSLDLAGVRQRARARGDFITWPTKNQEVRKSITADLAIFVDKKSDEMESNKLDMKVVYLNLKDLTRKNTRKCEVIKNKDGVLLTETEQILGKWAEYCSGLYQDKWKGQLPD